FNGDARVGFKEGAGVEVSDISVPVASNLTVYVVANVPSTVKLKEEARTLTEFKKLEADVIPTTSSTDMVMSGFVENVNIKAGKNFIGKDATHGENVCRKKPLELKRINARVEVSRFEDKMDDNGYKDYTLQFNGAELYLNLVRNESQLIANDNTKDTDLSNTTKTTPNKIYAYGVAPKDISDPNYFTTHHWVSGLNKEKSYVLNENVKLKLSTEVANAKLYAFSNYDEAHPTMVVLKAKLLYKGKELSVLDNAKAKEKAEKAEWVDADGYTYFPIRINHFDDNSYRGTPNGPKDVISRNYTYQFGTITIKRPGTNDPNNNLNGSLDVVCTVMPWNVVTQTVTW
ncbi:MAG: hypothetical protein Q4A76_09415, partial [Porphyromonadaceae bacterium]|nr:hypothetical protein [Porphyromonadaceae bacterium]